MRRTVGAVVVAIAAMAGCGGGDEDDAETELDENDGAGSLDEVPVGDPVDVEVEVASWTFVVSGYDASVRANESSDDGSTRVTVPGKRYAVTTVTATNNGEELQGVSAYFNWEYAVGGVTTTSGDQCTFFQNDDYSWTEALDTYYAEVMPGATAEVAICRLVDDGEVDEVQLIIEPKLSDKPIVAAVQ